MAERIKETITHLYTAHGARFFKIFMVFEKNCNKNLLSAVQTKEKFKVSSHKTHKDFSCGI